MWTFYDISSMVFLNYFFGFVCLFFPDIPVSLTSIVGDGCGLPVSPQPYAPLEELGHTSPLSH